MPASESLSVRRYQLRQVRRVACLLSGVCLAAGSLARLAEGNERVDLPAVKVAALPEDLPWRYARTGDTEVLVDGVEKDAREIVAARYRGLRLLPESIFGNRAGQHALILFNQKTASPSAPDRLRLVDKYPGDGLDSGQIYTGSVLRLAEGHLFVTVANVHEFEGVSAILTDHIPAFLRRQKPEFPPWFSWGLLARSGPFHVVKARRNWGSVTLEQLTWPGAASVADKLPEHAASFPTFAVMFDPARDPEGMAQAERDLFEFQTGLFARWSLFGPRKNGRNAAGYWVFAEFARRGQAREDVFRQCYGLDWPAACAEMRAYLRSKGMGPVEVRFPAVVEPPPPDVEKMKFRDASPAEIVRLLGNYLRLQAKEQRKTDPAAAAKAASAARRILRKGLEKSPSDQVLRALLDQVEAEAATGTGAGEFISFLEGIGFHGETGGLAGCMTSRLATRNQLSQHTERRVRRRLAATNFSPRG